eukprot:256909_1
MAMFLSFHALFSLLSTILLQRSIATTNTYQFTKSESVCDQNPLKGFVTSPSWGIQTDFPISLEFHYISLRDVMVDLTTFTWDSGLEPLLNATSARNRHAIVRFYIDYPTKSTGVPQFLIDDGLNFNSYGNYGGGESPDYTDANLKNALSQFIAAFGARYDGDPRIAVIQLGLLGFWGEWHTYPHEDWEWNDGYANDIMNAWNNAFAVTQLNVRYASTESIAYRLGYHDDSFAYATYDASEALDWFFYTQIVAAGATEQWQSNMIGGEIYPDLQEALFSPSYEIAQYAQDWDLCVHLTHATYMLNARAYDTEYDESNGEYETALGAMRSLGYFVYLDYVTTETVAYNQVQMNVKLINDGIAPFYYDLKLVMTISNAEKGYEQVWDENSLSVNTFGANTNYVLSDIVITFEDDDLIRYFGDETSGEFDAVFDVSFKLYSSMAYEGNPIRLCNSEIAVANALNLNGSVDETPNTTDEPMTTDMVDPTADVSACTVQTLIAIFVMVAIEMII